eukprot:PhF_6_TR2164/c0_g1_i1/m.3524
MMKNEKRVICVKEEIKGKRRAYQISIIITNERDIKKEEETNTTNQIPFIVCYFCKSQMCFRSFFPFFLFGVEYIDSNGVNRVLPSSPLTPGKQVRRKIC